MNNSFIVKNVAIMVSIAMMVTSVTFVAPSVVAQDNVSDLQAQLARLQAQLASLQGGSQTTSVVASTSSNAACPYTFGRNLTLGSTGDDVRQLQRFLNGNSATRVSSNGAGSPGNETSYYGPATANAVKRFQELNAAQVLTPLGLSVGTGGFYTSTRNHANNQCRGSVVSVGGSTKALPTSTAAVRVSGNNLAITPAVQPADGYAVKGAQRVPYTTFVLTAGREDVVVSNVRVKKFGLGSRSNIENVALVDSNGVLLTKSRTLNSNDEAVLVGNFEVPANRSVTVTVVGNVATDDDVKSGAVVGFEVLEVNATERVTGDLPLRGAAHVLSNAVNLQKITVKSDSTSSSEVRLNREEDLGTFSLEFESSVSGKNADSEDGYLRSITFEQQGTADTNEVGRLTLLADDREADYSLEIQGDRYVFTFDAPGLLIEEDEEIELNLKTETNDGSERTIQFVIDDVSDIYVVGRTYGYGLPVSKFTGSSNELSKLTIQGGNVSGGGNVSDFEDEVTPGDDVVLGALEVEFEGEDIYIEDPKFNFKLSGFKTGADSPWDKADAAKEDLGGTNVRYVRIENLKLLVDGRVVAYADNDALFYKPATKTIIWQGEHNNAAPTTEASATPIEFSGSFEIDVRDERDVVFEVVGDLDEDWTEFDGAAIEVSLNKVDTAEGVVSDTDYTTNTDTKTRYFSSKKDFDSVKIVGNKIRFSIDDDTVSEDTFVSGSKDVSFGVLVVDATDSQDDIELRNIDLTFTPAGEFTPAGASEAIKANIGDLNNCALYDGNNRVSDEEDLSRSITAKEQNFDLNDYEVKAGEEVVFDVRCDIDDDASPGHKYTLGVALDKEIKYRVGRERKSYKFAATSSDQITVTSTGKLRIAADSQEEASFIALEGSSAQIFTIEVEAMQEDIKIEDLFLDGFDLKGVGVASQSDWDNTIAEIRLLAGSRVIGRADPDSDYESSNTRIKFENVNYTLERDEEEKLHIVVEFKDLTKRRGSAGVYVAIDNVDIDAVGNESGETLPKSGAGSTYDIKTSKLATARVFNTYPTVSTSERNLTLANGNNRVLYEFSVSANSNEDVYLDKISAKITASTGVTVAGIHLRRDGDDDTLSGADLANVVATGASRSFLFHTTDNTPAREAYRIAAGTTVRFEIVGDVTGVVDNSSIQVELEEETEALSDTTTVGRASGASSIASAKFVWSPNLKEDDGSLATLDWFNGADLIDSPQSWNHEK